MRQMLGVVTISMMTVALWGAAARAEMPLDFDRDVKPILEQHCFRCHGPEKQKGGLRLDLKANALAGGDSEEPAIVPGNVVKSHLLKLVASKDPDSVMPPKGERLKTEEIALLSKWVETGAHWVEKSKAAEPVVAVAVAEKAISDEDRKFWSFVAPQKSETPRVKNEKWAKGKIDRFVLHRMESAKLEPVEEASRQALIRRVSFDLTGLPPTPEEVRAFLSDQSATAYERVVARLLGSPRFGERVASLWLPLARYAEDQAHQVGDDTKYFYPYAYKYRQWVIDAFNRDLPYDQFIMLQLAADKVTEGKKEDLAALGFLGLGPKYYNRNRLEVMADEWEDRVDTVSRTMLGLTVACARCHDHKFDPISTRDYYGLAGVFASTKMVNKTADGKVQKDVKAQEMDPETLHIVEDGDVQNLNVFIRGNADRKGPVAPRRFLSILSKGEPKSFTEGSGRKELAMCIASKENPLTARVMVNRVWGMLLGAYLVATPSNFGHSGQPPVDQALLDDLAVRFMEHGWSIKWLVREIVTSATYRQSARVDESDVAADPSNEMHWRANRRRLTVEQWRDSILFVSGNLDLSGGKSMELDDPKNFKRTVHARISRLKLNDLLTQFDYPDANVHAEKRSVTSTPLQRLFMINSPFMLSQAKVFAGRLAKEAPESDEKRIERAYQLLYGRSPSRQEKQLGMEFVARPILSGMTRWEEYAQVLLASNEAFYVD